MEPAALLFAYQIAACSIADGDQRKRTPEKAV
jgi:hypothetical protein